MTAKCESSKLSTAEKLARKRAAARLRQQRCRARKRQAMLEKKRHESEQQTSRVGVTPQSPAVVLPPVAVPLSTNPGHHHRVPQQPHRIPVYTSPSTKPEPALPSPAGEHIYTCISFESQRSFEEAQKNLKVQTTTLEAVSDNTVPIVSPTSSPPRNPEASIIRVPDEKSIDQLVPEEEAAIVAMLSLKSGSEKPFLTSKGDEDRNQPPVSPPTAPQVVEVQRATAVEATGTTKANTKFSLVNMTRSYPRAAVGASEAMNRSQNHHRRIEVSSHYEMFEYGHPSRTPPASRGLSHMGYFHYHRVPVGIHPPPYRRGYFTAPPTVVQRRYPIRYDYE
ncbi:hypothetical protein IV203_038308 [Nitzschia inconspicua]|uniref:Uncharacterized protein n=1 Tax=Nitzschia inconspicua TaxID=303405 RepID=A0A9K3LMD2_9STRA|nr:hypothetical protein IV203_038308 [Nitzschia inconspicua]